MNKKPTDWLALADPSKLKGQTVDGDWFVDIAERIKELESTVRAMEATVKVLRDHDVETRIMLAKKKDRKP